MQTIERMILNALLRDMRAAGYQPAAVWDDGAYVMAQGDHTESYDDPIDAPERIERPLTDAEAIEAIDSVDVSTLHFTRRNKDTWGNRGVMIVLGNGEDCISDYHCPDNEPFADIVTAIYDKLNNGGAL